MSTRFNIKSIERAHHRSGGKFYKQGGITGYLRRIEEAVLLNHAGQAVEEHAINDETRFRSYNKAGRCGTVHLQDYRCLKHLTLVYQHTLTLRLNGQQELFDFKTDLYGRTVNASG